MAVFWDRTTEPGAFWGLTCGLIIGGTRMMIEFAAAPPGCGEADRRAFLVSKLAHKLFNKILTDIFCYF